MVQANIRETKAKLSAYLALVEQGEEVVIVRRGKPVAVLKPVEKSAPLGSMRELREKIKIKGPAASKTIIQMRKESRY